MARRTRAANFPPGYDARKFSAFAVTVDVVILTMAEGVFHVLLVRRGQEPFKSMWAIPGGFKRPEETLGAANFRRRLVGEEGWVIPTLRTARPGPGGGRPAELYRAGRAWRGAPIQCVTPNR